MDVRLGPGRQVRTPRAAIAGQENGKLSLTHSARLVTRRFPLSQERRRVQCVQGSSFPRGSDHPRRRRGRIVDGERPRFDRVGATRVVRSFVRPSDTRVHRAGSSSSSVDRSSRAGARDDRCAASAREGASTRASGAMTGRPNGVDGDADDAEARGAMQEAIVRAVHGFRGSFASATKRARAAAEKAVEALESRLSVMDATETLTYIKMVTFPRERDDEVFVARPGFVLTYDLEPVERAPHGTNAEKIRPPFQKIDDQNGRAKAQSTARVSSITTSGASAEGGERSTAPAPAGAARTTATSSVMLSYADKLEVALEKTLKSAEEAENAQGKLEELTAAMEETQVELSKVKVPFLKPDFSDMPSFELTAEAREFKGDANDRKEILAHKRWVEQETERMVGMKREWMADRRKETKKKAKMQACGNLIDRLNQLKAKIKEASETAKQTLSVATADAKHLDSLRSKATTAQQREDEKQSRDAERQALREKKLLEPRSKTAKEIARDERRAAAKAEREKERLLKAEEAKMARQKASRYPMDDVKLIAFDAAEAKAQGREPWPEVSSGTAWKPSEACIHHMEVCEFLNTFGNSLNPAIEPLSVQTLRILLNEHDLTRLAAIYVALLKLAVTNASSQYATLVNMWVASIDEGTFPEVLQHYVKVKINLSASRESAYETVDLLKDKLIGDLSADEHTCILAWLCRECSETRFISKEVDARVLKLESLRKERQRKDNVISQQEKELAKSRETDATLLEEARKLIEEEDSRLPTMTSENDVDESKMDALAKARTVVETEDKLKELSETREANAVQRQLEDDEIKIRARCLGLDRHGTKYYWNIALDASAIFACSTDETWSQFTCEEQVKALRASLNEKGIQERRLARNIDRTLADMTAGFERIQFESMFPKSNLRKNPEAWLEISARETLALEYTRRSISLLMADVVNYNASAPDGTMSGWRIWGRELNRLSDLKELTRYLFQIEETILEMSELPKDMVDTSRSAIESTNEILRENARRAMMAAELNGDESVVPFNVSYSYEWWELIIPDEKVSSRRRVWKTNQQRAIWREAMSDAKSFVRLAYGASMLTFYSRNLFGYLAANQVRARRESTRNLDYANAVREFEAEGFRVY